MASLRRFPNCFNLEFGGVCRPVSDSVPDPVGGVWVHVHLMKIPYLKPAALSAVLWCSATCADTGAVDPPSPPDPTAIYIGVRGVALLDESSEVRVLETIPAPGLGATVQSETGQIVAVTSRTGGGAEVREIDACASDSYRLIAQVRQPLDSTGIVIINGTAMALSGSGETLAIGHAELDERFGLALLNVSAGRTVGFIPRLTVESVEHIPRRQHEIEWAVVGERNGLEEAIYLIGKDGEVLDSLSRSSLPVSSDIFYLAAADDGRSLTVRTRTHLFRLALPALTVEAETALEAMGSIALLDDGSVIVADSGVWPDSPGSGYVYRVSGDFTSVDSIDVSTPLGGTPESRTATLTRTVSVAAGGSVALVSAGTTEIGPTFPIQPPKVMEIDLATHNVVRSIDVGALGVGVVYALPGC